MKNEVKTSLIGVQASNLKKKWIRFHGPLFLSKISFKAKGRENGFFGFSILVHL